MNNPQSSSGEERVILVSPSGSAIGSCEKIKTHRMGYLHRAFSVFIHDGSGNWLLQKRNRRKYHSGGLWSNACCSHPKPGEDLLSAVRRRLMEELGIDCPVTEAFSLIYRARLDSRFIEHEFDHVFVGKYQGDPRPAKEEVEEWKWISENKMRESVRKYKSRYTYWFKLLLNRFEVSDGHICYNNS